MSPPSRVRRPQPSSTLSRAQGHPPTKQRPASSTATRTHPPPSPSTQPQPATPCPGDSHWLRVMATKEAQWRFLNSVALHNLSICEADACAELDQLATVLRDRVDQAARLQRIVDTCTKKRALLAFNQLAQLPLTKLCQEIDRLQPIYENAAHVLMHSATVVHLDPHGLSVSSAELFARELARFRDVATNFLKVADHADVPRLVAACDALQKLSRLVTSTLPANVVAAADDVTEAAHSVEREKCVHVAQIVETRAPAVANAPSFVE